MIFLLPEEPAGKETLRVLCVLGAPAVSCISDKFTAKTQSALRLRREKPFFRQTPGGATERR